MKYSSIFRDTYYTTTANSLTYRIELDGDIIYYGRAIKFPGADILKININKVCRDYLSSNINLILGGASAQTNENALRTFNLIDVTTGNILEQYTFLYDWNYVELWTGQTQNRYYKEGETPETNYITVSPASLNSIPSTGGTFTIVVNSNVPWRTNAVGVYPTTGNAGSTTVRITVGENPYDTRYSGSKTFYMVGDTSVSATFKYFQDAESTTGTTVDIYPTTLDNIPETGGTYTITVYSNGDWRTDVPSWVTVTPQTGSGNGTITLVVAPNNGTARQGSITVLTDNDMASVIVSQDASTQTDYITVSPSEIRNIPASGGTYYVNLFSNVAWKKRFADQNIVPSAGTAGNYTIAITVPSGELPTKYYYRFVKQGDTSVEAIVTAYQNGFDALKVAPEVLTNAESGGTTYTINITTTEDWTVSVPEWATVSASSGTGNGSITVTVSDNSGSTRSGNVVIETSNSNKTLSITQYGLTVDTSEYFTVEFVSGGSINFAAPSSGDSLTMYYSKNGSAWTNITSSLGSVETLYGNTGDVIRFKGTDYFQTYWDKSTNGIIYNNSEDSTTKVKIYGNIMSTIYGDDFSGQTTASNYMFCGCFRNLNVVDASRLVLPSTTLKYMCYHKMFGGCKYLINAPQLPATTLGTYCYQNMFQGCTSLVNAPELPATTLAPDCYENMFYGCTSLVNAPVLPATTLANWCYAYMFAGCTSLFNPPALPATNLSGCNNCYMSMFLGCTSLTTAPALPATTLANSCYYQMFSNCTALANAPSILPAMELTYMCYHFMFNGCTSLTTAPELPATNVTATRCYNCMFNNCSSLNYIKCMATDISGSEATGMWTYGVASAGTFVKNSAMEDWTTGYGGIPTNWIVENEGEIDYSTMPLTFEILSDGVINWKTTNTGFTKTIEYKLNDGSWTSITSSTGGTSISVYSGDTVQFRGDNAAYTSNDKNLYRNSFGLTTQFNIYGNIMSLIDSTNFSSLTTLSSGRTFYQFFYGCNVIDASNLILPATTLTSNCYDSMFYGCSNLVTAPALPATTLEGSCYWAMFRDCTSLVTAPALPATILASNCYQRMFRGCTNLVNAPELLATTLVVSCYQQMFQGCSSLNYIKCLATDISAGNCTQGWVENVASTGTFVKDSTMEDWTTGDNGIPSNWTIENNS